MIVIDTSAIVAILQDEPERQKLQTVLKSAPRTATSAVSVLEGGIVLHSRRGPQGTELLNRFLKVSSVEVVAFDAVQALAAIDAFIRYGKGIHPTARPTSSPPHPEAYAAAASPRRT